MPGLPEVGATTKVKTELQPIRPGRQESFDRKQETGKVTAKQLLEKERKNREAAVGLLQELARIPSFEKQTIRPEIECWTDLRSGHYQ